MTKDHNDNEDEDEDLLLCSSSLRDVLSGIETVRSEMEQNFRRGTQVMWIALYEIPT